MAKTKRMHSQCKHFRYTDRDGSPDTGTCDFCTGCFDFFEPACEDDFEPSDKYLKELEADRERLEFISDKEMHHNTHTDKYAVYNRVHPLWRGDYCKTPRQAIDNAMEKIEK